MSFPGKYLVLLFTFSVLIMAGCKGKKKPSLTGDDPVEIEDFIEFFHPVPLSYQVSDSTLNRKEKDSLAISYKVFTQFVPDSLLSKVFGKGVKPKIYSLGRAGSTKAETYLFVKTLANDKKALFILGFDKSQKYVTALTALRPDNNAATVQTVSMDKRFTITKNIYQKNPDGTISEGKDVYVFSPETKEFVLVMTDALNDKVTELINPIDTLQRKNKFAGDYTNGKMNLVSVRDGRRSDRLNFFIHFEKNSGDCTGELKGEAILRSATTAEYREEGDPCVLKFIFSKTSVTLQELQGCGSRRGMKCSFDGSFAKKKYVKPAVPIKTGTKNK